MKFGSLPVAFWTGEGRRIAGACGPHGLLVYLYLRSAPEANLTGLYHTAPPIIGHRIGLPPDRVAEVLERLSALPDPPVSWDAAREEVLVRAMAEGQLGKLAGSDNRFGPIVRALREHVGGALIHDLAALRPEWGEALDAAGYRPLERVDAIDPLPGSPIGRGLRRGFPSPPSTSTSTSTSRDGSAREEREGASQAPSEGAWEGASAPVRAVLDAWVVEFQACQELLGFPRSAPVVTHSARAAVEAALARGHDVEHLIQAVRALRYSRWHLGLDEGGEPRLGLEQALMKGKTMDQVSTLLMLGAAPPAWARSHYPPWALRGEPSAPEARPKPEPSSHPEWDRLLRDSQEDLLVDLDGRACYPIKSNNGRLTVWAANSKIAGIVREIAERTGVALETTT